MEEEENHHQKSGECPTNNNHTAMETTGNTTNRHDDTKDKETKNHEETIQGQATKLTFSLSKNKKKKTTVVIQQESQPNKVESQTIEFSTYTKEGPLSIPVQQNKNRCLLFLSNKQTLKQEETAAATAEMVSSSQPPPPPTNNSSSNSIGVDPFRRELEELPDEVLPHEFVQDKGEDTSDDDDNDPFSTTTPKTTHSTNKKNIPIPIADFGRAMLRGMGWKGDDDATNNNNNPKNKKDSDDSFAYPRPHRLGLGAIPKELISNELEKGKTTTTNNKSSHTKKNKLTIDQKEFFTKQLNEQKRFDKQKTLQNLSIVYLKNTTLRAQIIQLVGVPGLNQVKILKEKDSTYSVIKRSEIDKLVPREELETYPFINHYQPQKLGTTNNGNDNNTETNKKNKTKGDDDDDEESRSKSSSSSTRKDSNHDTTRVKKSDDDDSNKDSDDDSYKRSKRKREKETTKKRQRKDRSRSRSIDSSSASDDHRRRRRKRDRREYSRERDRKGRKRDRHDRHDRHRDRHRDRDRQDRRDRDRHDRRDKKRDSDRKPKSDTTTTKDTSKETVACWIIPNIRVRIITKKYGNEHFKQKGTILDVVYNRSKSASTSRQQAVATIQMNHNNILLEHVPEKYLETVLPNSNSTDDMVIILTGKYKWFKGKLLEKNLKTSQGIIQIINDDDNDNHNSYDNGIDDYHMNIVTLSLDDIAQYIKT